MADYSQQTGPITLVGLIKMEPNSTEADFSRALFGKLDTGLSADYIESYFAPSIDTCEVTKSDGANNNPNSSFNIYDRPTQLISAGETVIVSSAGGTYATLNRELNDSGPYYETNVRLTGSAPNGLSVGIPGEQFPQFENIDIADVPALNVTNPTVTEDVTASTEFRWTPNDVFRSVIEINTSGPGATNNEVINVNCTVVDDGAFSFPLFVRNEMGENFIDNWSSYLRITYNVVQSDNAIVFTANSVQN